MSFQPQFQAVGSRVTFASAASIAAIKPAVSSVSGILICAASSKNNATHSCATTGWSKLTQVNSGASFTTSYFYAAEGAAAPTITWTGAAACAAQIAYYACPDAPMSIAIGATRSNTGTTSPHTVSGITTTAANSTVIVVDTAAANTAVGTATGFTKDADAGSATDAGRNSWFSVPEPSSGTTSPNYSATGAVAAWVSFQLELLVTGPSGNVFQISKAEMGSWLKPPAGLVVSKAENSAWIRNVPSLWVSKLEASGWLRPPTGHAVSKAEAAAWLRPPTGMAASKLEASAWLVNTPFFGASKLENSAWLRPPAGLASSKLEVSAWLAAVTGPTAGQKFVMIHSF